MWIRSSTATLLVFATTVALAASQDYQIVKVASVASATIDTLKPRTIFFTDHRTDETSDKGAFIRFDEWSRIRPVESKFLNLFPGFKEGMVHKIIDGSKKEVKDELQMYVTEARFMLSRPADTVNLNTFATLPFIQSIDPSIKHEAIKPSDVSTLKDEKGTNNKNPDRAWCEGTGVTACIRSSYKLEGKLPIGVALANKLRDSEKKLSDTIEFESEMRLLKAADLDEAGLKKLTGVDHAGHRRARAEHVLRQPGDALRQAYRCVPAEPGRRQEHHHHRGDRACGRLEHARSEEEVRERAGAAQPGAVAGAARQQLVQHRRVRSAPACRAMSATASRRSPEFWIAAEIAIIWPQRERPASAGRFV